MNRSYKSVWFALLVGAMVLAVNPAWARHQDQTQQTTAAAQEKQDPAEGYTEEEYDAYDKAVNKETDPDKKADLLIAFMEKYPKSKLQVYIVTAYETLMFETQKAGNYSKLESLAERWQKFYPNDQKTLVFLTDAVQKQGKNEKFMVDGSKLFASNPSPALAYMLYETAQKMKDDAKQTEWGQKLLGYPEYNDNFMLRMYFVAQNANDLGKAADFAQQALKSLALAKKPEATPQPDWNKAVNYVQVTCNRILGLNYYESGKYTQAIQALEKVLKLEKTDQAYYYIGMSQWKLNSVEDAYLSFAVAELMKGEYASKAKENFDTLYKSTHNGNTTGSDKVYRRAQAILDGKGTQ